MPCLSVYQVCKEHLLSELGLPSSVDAPQPLVAIVSRLTQQKGLPLIVRGIEVAIERGAQVLAVGLSSLNSDEHALRRRVLWGQAVGSPLQQIQTDRQTDRHCRNLLHDSPLPGGAPGHGV
jgi:hypothetical protein